MRGICLVIACSACVTEPVDVPEVTSRVYVVEAPLLRYPNMYLYAVCVPIVRACEGWLIDEMPDGTRRERRFEPCTGDDGVCWALEYAPQTCSEVFLDFTAFIAEDASYTFARFECELE